MIPEIRNYSYHLRIQDLNLISLVQRRLRGQQIEVLKYLNRFTTASARWLFDYDLNDRTRNYGAKLIVKYFSTSVARYFYPIKITTMWNSELFQEQLGQTLGRESPYVLVGSNHQCHAQFKCAQTVLGQRFAGNGPYGLSYYLESLPATSATRAQNS